jgi:hypothetical protein
MSNKIAWIIMVVAFVIAVGAAAITINGYDSVYAESATKGGSFNFGNSHQQCSAAQSGHSCTGDPRFDEGKHTVLLP